MWRGGHRAPQAAGSARRPPGEAAPDRNPTFVSLQSERHDPPTVEQKTNEGRGWGGEEGGAAGDVGLHALTRLQRESSRKFSNCHKNTTILHRHDHPETFKDLSHRLLLVTSSLHPSSLHPSSLPLLELRERKCLCTFFYGPAAGDSS